MTITDTQKLLVPSVSKIAPVFLGGLIAFSLFVMMAKLIEQDAVIITETKPPVIIDNLFKEPEPKTIKRTLIKPPEKIEQPPTKPLPNYEPNDGNQEFANNFPINNRIDSIKVEPNLGINTTGMARPVVRVNPKYPTDAANRGIEGWVQLSFNIGPDGSVVDIEVVDAEPKRVFDREASRALKRWKYKPSIEQGKPVKQFGMSVVLDFKLGSE